MTATNFFVRRTDAHAEADHIDLQLDNLALRALSREWADPSGQWKRLRLAIDDVRGLTRALMHPKDVSETS